jgi:hypothetical protein
MAPPLKKTEESQKGVKGATAGSAAAKPVPDELAILKELEECENLLRNLMVIGTTKTKPVELYKLSKRIDLLERDTARIISIVNPQDHKKIVGKIKEFKSNYEKFKRSCFLEQHLRTYRDVGKYPKLDDQLQAINLSNLLKATASLSELDVKKCYDEYQGISSNLRATTKDTATRAVLQELEVFYEGMLLYYQSLLKNCLKQLIDGFLFDEHDKLFNKYQYLYSFGSNSDVVSISSQDFSHDLAACRLYQESSVAFAIGGAQSKDLSLQSLFPGKSQILVVSLFPGAAIQRYNIDHSLDEIIRRYDQRFSMEENIRLYDASLPTKEAKLQYKTTVEWQSSSSQCTVKRIPLQPDATVLVNGKPISSLVFSTLCHDCAKKLVDEKMPIAIFLEGSEANRLLFATGIYARLIIRKSAPKELQQIYSANRLFAELLKESKDKPFGLADKLWGKFQQKSVGDSSEPLSVLSTDQKLLLFVDWFTQLVSMPASAQKKCTYLADLLSIDEQSTKEVGSSAGSKMTDALNPVSASSQVADDLRLFVETITGNEAAKSPYYQESLNILARVLHEIPETIWEEKVLLDDVLRNNIVAINSKSSLKLLDWQRSSLALAGGSITSCDELGSLCEIYSKRPLQLEKLASKCVGFRCVRAGVNAQKLFENSVAEFATCRSVVKLFGLTNPGTEKPFDTLLNNNQRLLLLADWFRRALVQPINFIGEASGASAGISSLRNWLSLTEKSVKAVLQEPVSPSVKPADGVSDTATDTSEDNKMAVVLDPNSAIGQVLQDLQLFVEVLTSSGGKKLQCYQESLGILANVLQQLPDDVWFKHILPNKNLRNNLSTLVERGLPNYDANLFFGKVLNYEFLRKAKRDAKATKSPEDGSITLTFKSSEKTKEEKKVELLFGASFIEQLAKVFLENMDKELIVMQDAIKGNYDPAVMQLFVVNCFNLLKGKQLSELIKVRRGLSKLSSDDVEVEHGYAYFLLNTLIINCDKILGGNLENIEQLFNYFNNHQAEMCIKLPREIIILYRILLAPDSYMVSLGLGAKTTDTLAMWRPILESMFNHPKLKGLFDRLGDAKITIPVPTNNKLFILFDKIFFPPGGSIVTSDMKIPQIENIICDYQPVFGVINKVRNLQIRLALRVLFSLDLLDIIISNKGAEYVLHDYALISDLEAIYQSVTTSKKNLTVFLTSQRDQFIGEFSRQFEVAVDSPTPESVKLAKMLCLSVGLCSGHQYLELKEKLDSVHDFGSLRTLFITIVPSKSNELPSATASLPPPGSVLVSTPFHDALESFEEKKPAKKSGDAESSEEKIGEQVVQICNQSALGNPDELKSVVTISKDFLARADADFPRLSMIETNTHVCFTVSNTTYKVDKNEKNREIIALLLSPGHSAFYIIQDEYICFMAGHSIYKFKINKDNEFFKALQSLSVAEIQIECNDEDVCFKLADVVYKVKIIKEADVSRVENKQLREETEQLRSENEQFLREMLPGNKSALRFVSCCGLTSVNVAPGRTLDKQLQIQNFDKTIDFIFPSAVFSRNVQLLLAILLIQGNKKAVPPTHAIIEILISNMMLRRYGFIPPPQLKHDIIKVIPIVTPSHFRFTFCREYQTKGCDVTIEINVDCFDDLTVTVPPCKISVTGGDETYRIMMLQAFKETAKEIETTLNDRLQYSVLVARLKLADSTSIAPGFISSQAQQFILNVQNLANGCNEKGRVLFSRLVQDKDPVIMDLFKTHLKVIADRCEKIEDKFLLWLKFGQARALSEMFELCRKKSAGNSDNYSNTTQIGALIENCYAIYSGSKLFTEVVKEQPHYQDFYRAFCQEFLLQKLQKQAQNFNAIYDDPKKFNDFIIDLENFAVIGNPEKIPDLTFSPPKQADDKDAEKIPLSSLLIYRNSPLFRPYAYLLFERADEFLRFFGFERDHTQQYAINTKSFFEKFNEYCDRAIGIIRYLARPDIDFRREGLELLILYMLLIRTRVDFKTTTIQPGLKIAGVGFKDETVEVRYDYLAEIQKRSIASKGALFRKLQKLEDSQLKSELLVRLGYVSTLPSPQPVAAAVKFNRLFKQIHIDRGDAEQESLLITILQEIFALDITKGIADGKILEIVDKFDVTLVSMINGEELLRLHIVSKEQLENLKGFLKLASEVQSLLEIDENSSSKENIRQRQKLAAFVPFFLQAFTGPDRVALARDYGVGEQSQLSEQVIRENREVLCKIFSLRSHDGYMNSHRKQLLGCVLKTEDRNNLSNKLFVEIFCLHDLEFSRRLELLSKFKITHDSRFGDEDFFIIFQLMLIIGNPDLYGIQNLLIAMAEDPSQVSQISNFLNRILENNICLVYPQVMNVLMGALFAMNESGNELKRKAAACYAPELLKIISLPATPKTEPEVSPVLALREQCFETENTGFLIGYSVNRSVNDMLETNFNVSFRYAEGFTHCFISKEARMLIGVMKLKIFEFLQNKEKFLKKNRLCFLSWLKYLRLRFPWEDFFELTADGANNCAKSLIIKRGVNEEVFIKRLAEKLESASKEALAKFVRSSDVFIKLRRDERWDFSFKTVSNTLLFFIGNLKEAEARFDASDQNIASFVAWYYQTVSQCLKAVNFESYPYISEYVDFLIQQVAQTSEHLALDRAYADVTRVADTVTFKLKGDRVEELKKEAGKLLNLFAEVAQLILVPIQGVEQVKELYLLQDLSAFFMGRFWRLRASTAVELALFLQGMKHKSIQDPELKKILFYKNNEGKTASELDDETIVTIGNFYFTQLNLLLTRVHECAEEVPECAKNILQVHDKVLCFIFRNMSELFVNVFPGNRKTIFHYLNSCIEIKQRGLQRQIDDDIRSLSLVAQGSKVGADDLSVAESIKQNRLREIQQQKSDLQKLKLEFLRIAFRVRDLAENLPQWQCSSSCFTAAFSANKALSDFGLHVSEKIFGYVGVFSDSDLKKAIESSQIFIDDKVIESIEQYAKELPSERLRNTINALISKEQVALFDSLFKALVTDAGTAANGEELIPIAINYCIKKWKDGGIDLQTTSGFALKKRDDEVVPMGIFSITLTILPNGLCDIKDTTLSLLPEVAEKFSMKLNGFYAELINPSLSYDELFNVVNNNCQQLEIAMLHLKGENGMRLFGQLFNDPKMMTIIYEHLPRIEALLQGTPEKMAVLKEFKSRFTEISFSPAFYCEGFVKDVGDFAIWEKFYETIWMQKKAQKAEWKWDKNCKVSVVNEKGGLFVSDESALSANFENDEFKKTAGAIICSRAPQVCADAVKTYCASQGKDVDTRDYRVQFDATAKKDCLVAKIQYKLYDLVADRFIGTLEIDALVYNDGQIKIENSQLKVDKVAADDVASLFSQEKHIDPPLNGENYKKTILKNLGKKEIGRSGTTWYLINALLTLRSWEVDVLAAAIADIIEMPNDDGIDVKAIEKIKAMFSLFLFWLEDSWLMLPSSTKKALAGVSKLKQILDEKGLVVDSDQTDFAAGVDSSAVSPPAGQAYPARQEGDAHSVPGSSDRHGEASSPMSGSMPPAKLGSGASAAAPEGAAGTGAASAGARADSVAVHCNPNYRYECEQINTYVEAVVKHDQNIGDNAVGCTYLLKNKFPESGTSIQYHVAVAPPVDSRGVTATVACKTGGSASGTPIDAHFTKKFSDPDALDELYNVMKSEEESQGKILFAYNDFLSHWELAEIQFHKRGNKWIIEMYKHNPYGKGQFSKDETLALQQAINLKFSGIVWLPTFSSPESIFNRRQAPGDVTSCGVIVADDLIRRIKGAPLDQTYDVGAMALREKQRETVKKYLTTGSDKNVADNFERVVTSAPVDGEAKSKASISLLGRIAAQDAKKIKELIRNLENNCVRESLVSVFAQDEKDQQTFIIMIYTALEDNFMLELSNDRVTPEEYARYLQVSEFFDLKKDSRGVIHGDIKRIEAVKQSFREDILRDGADRFFTHYRQSDTALGGKVPEQCCIM